MTRLHVVSSTCQPGAKHNEDAWGSLNSAVWIIDGATGLGNSRVFRDGDTDAQWFASKLNEVLKVANWEGPPQKALMQAANLLRQQIASQFMGSSIDSSLWPFASIAGGYLWNGSVNLFSLGDCRILWRCSACQEAHGFGCSPVTQLDRSIVTDIRTINSTGIWDWATVFSLVSPKIKRNRELINVPGGYGVLDAEGRGLTYLQYLSVPEKQVRQLLLCTDGYMRCLSPFGMHTENSLFQVVLEDGVGGVLDELRRLETKDAEGRVYPRIKPSDDATAVLVELVDA